MSAFQHTIQPYVRGSSPTKQLMMYPHNLVPQLFWTETGCRAAFLWLLVQAFRTSVQGWEPSSLPTRGGLLYLGGPLPMAAVMVHGIGRRPPTLDGPYLKNDLGLEFCTPLAVPRVRGRRTRSSFWQEAQQMSSSWLRSSR